MLYEMLEQKLTQKRLKLGVRNGNNDKRQCA